VSRSAAARGAGLLGAATAAFEAGGNCGMERAELAGSGGREAPHLELARRRRHAGHREGQGLGGVSWVLLRIRPHLFG
jgi:hypothetical protein